MNKNLTYIIGLTLIISCTPEDGAIGPSGLNSLILTTEESEGGEL